MSVVAVLCVIASYLIGSFPTAFLVGRANGMDLRTVGSGNLGATNVLRTLGWRAGLLVFVVDMAKGALPVIGFPALLSVARGWPWGVVFGLAAIAGHVRPVYLLGKGGGKGVATASGAFFGLAPLPALAALVAFLVVTGLSRFVSLGSLIGAVTLVVALWWQERHFSPLVAAGACVAMFVFWTHRENIERLRKGTERRLGVSAE